MSTESNHPNLEDVLQAETSEVAVDKLEQHIKSIELEDQIALLHSQDFHTVRQSITMNIDNPDRRITAVLRWAGAFNESIRDEATIILLVKRVVPIFPGYYRVTK